MYIINYNISGVQPLLRRLFGGGVVSICAILFLCEYDIIKLRFNIGKHKQCQS